MIAITAAHNEALLAGTLAFLDRGVEPARVRLYGGSRPASPDVVPSSAMLSRRWLAAFCDQMPWANRLTLSFSSKPRRAKPLVRRKPTCTSSSMLTPRRSPDGSAWQKQPPSRWPTP